MGIEVDLMVIGLNIQIDKRQLAQLTKELASIPKAAPKAISRGINDTVKSGRTKAKREIANHLALKVGQINKHISVKRASKTRYVGEINFDGKPIPLVDYVRNPESKIGKKKPLKIRVHKDKGAETHTTSFIGRGSGSGKPLVFKREGKAAYPIKALYGPTIAGAFRGNKTVHANTVKHINDNLIKNITRNVDLITSGIRK